MEMELLPNGEKFKFWDDQTNYSKVYHVATNHPKASDSNPGTEDLPFKTITKAASLVQPGEKVLVHEGTYRECVSPQRSGNDNKSMIAFEAASNEKVVIKGSNVWKPTFRTCEEFKTYHPPLTPKFWLAELDPELFKGYNPFLTNNMPAAFMNYGRNWSPDEVHKFQLRRGHLYMDGIDLEQVYSVMALATSTKNSFWVDDSAGFLCLKLIDDNDDPNNHSYEISVREQVFAPDKSGVGYIRVSGFTMQHSADPVPIPQRSLLSTNRGHHWIIENNSISFANASGIDIGNQSWYYRDKTPTGNHIIRKNTITDCGICGICGVHGVDDSLIEYNTIERVGTMDIEHIYECAGLKFHIPNNVLIRKNLFANIKSACGVWLDVMAKNCRICGNSFVNIETLLAGVYLELSRHDNLIDRNIFLNMKDAPNNNPPKDGIPGGMGFSSDCSDHAIVENNFFGNIQGHYATAFHLAQKERVMFGRVGLARGERCYSNLFAQCKKRILFSRTEDCFSDGNLFDSTNRFASYKIEFPAPAATLDLEGWKTYFNLDQQGSEVPMKLLFNEPDNTLTLIVQGDLPEAFKNGLLANWKEVDTVGPWKKSAWQKTGNEYTITIDLDPRNQ